MGPSIIYKTELDEKNNFRCSLRAKEQVIDISFSDHHVSINVCVRNAMSRAFNGPIGAGRWFKDHEEAMAGYRRDSVRDAIAFAVDLYREEQIKRLLSF
jgi:hypothetical protein